MISEEETLQSANILIADDDPAILRLFAHLLAYGGHRIRTASDGNQALHMILQECPDVLITDWIMPGFDGLELCRRVRGLHQRKVLPHYTYIIVLTAHSTKEHFIEGLDAGADYFVEKAAESITDLRIEIRARLKAALRTRKLENDLEFAAKYDAMTKLLNRVTFYDSAQVIWDRSIKNKFPLSVIMLDCDFFKRINDIHGHLVGDSVLREMAATLRNFTRTSDLICRYGGEEFCVLLPGCNEKTAWNWAERIRKQFEKFPIKHDELDIAITVSFGVAERMDDTVQFDQLIERADQALLFAKESGRNRCICFSETISEDAEQSQEFRTVHDLFDGIFAHDVMMPITLTVKSDETVTNVVDFFLKTQIETLPVVDKTGQFCGMVSEKNFISLVGNKTRWNEPIGDLVTPNVISYPVETPLKVLFDFLCRVSIRQIVIVDANRPVGLLSRGHLLRWMRNVWASISEDFDSIIPKESSSHDFADFQKSVGRMSKELDDIMTALEKADGDKAWNSNRFHLTATISQLQDLMDQILRSNAMQSLAPGTGSAHHIGGLAMD